jgi:hypothetical protein
MLVGNLTPSRIYVGLTLSPAATSPLGRAADGTGSDEYNGPILVGPAAARHYGKTAIHHLHILFRI